MRYYLYISDAKLDMLFAQIPAGTRERLAKELKFNIQVVSLSLREDPQDDTRYSKLAAVEAFIRNEMAVGTVDEPEAWFADELPMIIGPLGHQAEERPPVVYFSGATDQTVLGLGGAIRHMVGAREAAAHTYEFPSSSIAALLDVLEEEAELGDQDAIATREANIYGQLWPVFMERLLEVQKGVPQRVEFLAKRLTYTPPGSPQVERAALLGSPLYVAVVE